MGGFSEVPIAIADGLRVAQEQRHGLTVVTRDQAFAAYGLEILHA